MIPEGPAPEERRSGFVRFMVDVLETLILSVLLFAAINAISARIRVDGHSMEPTLLDGEFVIVNKLSYRIGPPQRGDVIVFRYPRDPEQEYIKRVVGLAGDEIRVLNGVVYVNDQPLDEPYTSAPPAYHTNVAVPEDSLFVLGDNRNNSSDSHNWGPVPIDFVIGKAMLVYWPPEQWGVINHPTPAVAAP